MSAVSVLKRSRVWSARSQPFTVPALVTSTPAIPDLPVLHREVRGAEGAVRQRDGPIGGDASRLVVGVQAIANGHDIGALGQCQ
eukprot:11123585-Alexandrium_andersonii.AAC.1